MSQRNLAIRLLITARDEASGVLGGLRRNAGKIAAAIVGYFGIKMFSGAISSAAAFQEQLSVVQAITKASVEEMELLRKAADEAGTNTRYTATEAAQALESLARAGLNARQSVETLPAVLALAQGNGLELGQAAGFVTKAVQGMGLAFDQAGRVSDVLSKAAASASTSVEGIGNALSYAAPTANALGLTLEQTVAIIGKFADSSIDASRAGTALNSILAQFSDPASKFRQEMASLGIYTTDFYEAMEQLANAGPAGQKAIRAVGLEAGPALQALLSKGIGSLKELRDELQNAEGSAQDAADTMDSNLNGALRGLGSAWDAVKRTLVDPLLDPITEQVTRLSSRLRSFVSEGVVQRAGEILASVFTTAQKNFNEFLDNFDLDQVVQQLKGWLDQTKETVDVWLERLQTASTYGKIAFLSIATGVQTLQATMHGFAGVLAQVIAGIIERFGAAFGLFSRFSSTARKLSEEADSLARSFRASAEENYQKAAEAIDKATDSGRELREAFDQLSETQQSASESIEKLVESEETLAEQSGITADQLDSLGDSADYVGGEAQQAATGIDAVTESASNANDELEKAEVAAAKLASAYDELGITSQSALDDAAEKSRQAFETIKSSGQVTTRELKQAFQAYAQRAIEANNGVASHALKAEAAQNGLKLTADETGRVIVESMRDAARATSDIKNAADDASGAYRRMAADAQKAGDAKNQSNGGSENDEGDKKERVTKSGGTFRAGKYSMSDLEALDKDLAQRAAEAVAALNMNLASDGSSTAYRKERYETAMRNIESAAKAAERRQESQRQSESTPEQKPGTSSLDELSKAMEQALAKAIPQAQAASKKTEVTLNLPTGKVTGMFDDTEADRLIRSLTDMARISR
ncbi:phage tail tape measure protein [Nitrincola iocasae]|uniref:Phage tail tape measure protein n=1 Tax=Nitrincola iocasae TaxID=2614693 RepID=A0A5J6LAV7_9GAMM|nr:phage tail tape measure protein [Nitrincola iocasae]QEW05657.1 phage tail tape measure protein [Nitrincola iocasae]